MQFTREQNWQNTELQAIRLCAEIFATQQLDLESLCESMDLDAPDLHELVDRICDKWEKFSSPARD